MPHPPASFSLHIFLANQPCWSSLIILMPLHPASSTIYDHASLSSVITIPQTLALFSCLIFKPYPPKLSKNLILPSHSTTFSSLLILLPYRKTISFYLIILYHFLTFSTFINLPNHYFFYSSLSSSRLIWKPHLLLTLSYCIFLPLLLTLSYCSIAWASLSQSIGKDN